MKSQCQRCSGKLDDRAGARACSHGCTFCETCSATLSHRCPNCGGELNTALEVA